MTQDRNLATRSSGRLERLRAFVQRVSAADETQAVHLELVQNELDGALARIHELEEEVGGLRQGAGALQNEFRRMSQQRDEARLQRDEARDQRDSARQHRGVPVEGPQREAQDRHLAQPKRHERIGAHMLAYLNEAGLSSGKILEIGGRDDPYETMFSSWAYHNLDVEMTGPDVLVADITSCPQIADESYDAVISVDVFAHIDRPWLAAEEIQRILKPGGVTYHNTPFSWRYNPCPIDFWRLTPDALAFLFAGLERIDAGFDDLERRRNILGLGDSAIAPDAFGGWRENWRVFYVGKKTS